MADETTDLAEVRLQKLRQIEALGLDPWGHRFDNAQPIGEIRKLPADKFDDAKSGPKVRAAGRVVRARTGGKLMWFEIWDQTGRVQLMVRVNKLTETEWQVAQLLDLGDIIGVDGEFGTTKTGELTIQVEKLTFLTKSLEPHPKDVYGMGDEEYRLRHRYLDMVYTPDTLRRAHQRVKIIRTIRNHLDAQGYMEVETPTLHAIAGGAAARPFETHHNALDIDLFVRIALELPLKRLLVGGIEKVYELGRVFRNEGISRKHNPEFTMLELYQSYGDYQTMMDLTEGLIVACVDVVGPTATVNLDEEYEDKGEKKTRAVPHRVYDLHGERHLRFGEKVVNFNPPFQRAKYGDLFKEHVGCDMTDEAAVLAAARAANIATEGKDKTTNYAEKLNLAYKKVAQTVPADAQPPREITTPKAHVVLVQELFEKFVEDALVGPVFVYDYPSPLCPLTKRKRENPAIAERFELYVHGMELANAYTELNDPITQEQTFSQQLAGLSDDDSMAKMDHDFIRALRHGMPPAGGLGIGIDRLVMLLTNTQTIRDVILFPLLRPEQK
ncbi:Lysine--tRNA ligase [Gemmata obscuriglobus]|uniref:Lysine--tRNA ligase n=1 Tax=Gemmata obscuriglobus TaxID=114 RepID=A0A2Z3HDF5_9BACT|nr:lysine--tRNA ligase [Gemmata obscuriglobus]AWM39714.1 lysine--tRNA ligase [Gemmata obscuriglobus]QEG27173.1 Lysine--tRNA ligase [Gemmata obscuriglobus]VTS03817.1 lysyl-trna synthetase : Lysine--tRNA ligase OS=Rhodopirellula maiorica SM1 GN=lysS PE=3 SV=1: tRNA_anti-codon: tRNA-synt_2 [Gemmata obscuriglobus UQM 2246]